MRLERIEIDPELGPVLHVTGADLMDGTPIYDIKPYVPLADRHDDAIGGFSESVAWERLNVRCPDTWLAAVPEGKRAALLGVLAEDPRPSYQEDPERIYGMSFAGLEVRFRVEGDTLTVVEITASE